MWTDTALSDSGREGGQTVRCFLSKVLTPTRAAQNGGTEAYPPPYLPFPDSSPTCF